MGTVVKPIMLDETGKRMADALERLIDKLGTHKITIIASTDDGVDIVDQIIKVYDVSTGALYASLIYNSPDTVSVDVPDGFSYKIVVECTLDAHYCSDKISGVANGDKTVTVTFKSLGNIATFADLQNLLDLGLGKYVELGTEVSFTHTEFGVITYEVVDYDSDLDEFTLLQKDTLNPEMEFDAAEALLKATDEMAAGNYMFKNGSTSLYFTLTKAVPAGGHIQATTSAFSVYSSAYETVVSEQGTVSSTVLEGATDLGTVASGTLNHMDRVNYGSNDYGESALRQYLNARGRNWWTAKTMFDRPPSYANRTGFLSGIPENVLSIIKTTSVKCVAQDTYCAPDSNHAKGVQYILNDKFFLASQMEVFGATDYSDGGRIFQLYVGASNTDRIKRYNGSSRYWWLRSPYPTASSVRIVFQSGFLDVRRANASFGVVPACKIAKSS